MNTTTATKPTDIKPPFDEEKAKLKVKAAENAWNLPIQN
jgi:nuclear transport factor 2 (NTF2) superfamily protein